MRHPIIGRALLGIWFVLVAFGGACSRAPDGGKPGAGPVPAASRPATAPTQDANAENPDRDRWVDLATVPFDARLIGGRFVQVRGTLASSLNAVCRAGGSSDVARMHKYLIGAPLLMESPDAGPGGFEVMPWAAAALPEEAADRLSQTWTLRDDLTWEDGRPVTAADYAFTFRMIRTESVTSWVAESLRDVAEIDALDARRFRVTWSRRNFRAMLTIGLDFPLVPAHAMPDDAVSFNKTTKHLACGPYRVSAFEPGRIEIVLRDEYRSRPFPPRPCYVERFVWEGGIRDPAATLTRLINGEAHLVGLNGDQYATQAAEAAFRKAAWRSHFFLPSYTFIAWNLRDPSDPGRPHPLLGDVRVRTALSHLVPLDLIAASIYRGLARPVSGPFDTRDPGCDAAVPPFPFDPPRAAALLAEAGFAAGSDGVLARDGRPLRITLARTGPLLAAVCQAFQEEARKAGVGIAIEDRPHLFEEDLPAHRFDAAMIYWQLDAIEPDVSSQFHSRSAGPESFNYSGYADAAADRLLDAHAASFDPSQRAGLRRGLHRLLHEHVPCTFLLANATTIGISRKFANVKVHDLGVRFHDFVLRELWEKHRPR